MARRVIRRGRRHTPNHIPWFTRLWNAVLSACLLAYGAYGLSMDDISLPGYGRRAPHHVHGAAAWLLYGAMVCAALNLLSVVVDHDDVRRNATNYRRFAKVT
jgi:hypothetical protein